MPRSLRPRVGLACAALVAGAVVGAARSAVAGGTQADVVAVGGRVWVTTGSGVAEIDASSGRVLRRVRTHYPYAIQVGASDRSVWVTSVENGFVSGALTRIPVDRRRRAADVLVFPGRPLLDLAVGSGTTWALAGPWRALRLIAVDQTTGRWASRPVRHDLGWIAADNTGSTPGLYGLAGHDVVRVRADGSTTTLVRVPGATSRPAVALGSVWVPETTGLVRIDPRTGRESRARVPGASAALAFGGGRVWMLAFLTRPRPHDVLVEIDSASLKVLRRVTLAGSFAAVSFGEGAVWAARSVPSITVVRIDARTLRQKVLATIL